MKQKLSRVGLWAVALQLLILACGLTGTGPSGGVTLYEHPNFEGDSQTFHGDFSDFSNLQGPCSGVFDAEDQEGNWDDCASSIRLAPGWEATVYERKHYLGHSLIVTEDTRDLDAVRGPCGNDWDDCIASIRVRRP